MITMGVKIYFLLSYIDFVLYYFVKLGILIPFVLSISFCVLAVSYMKLISCIHIFKLR